MFYPLGKRKLQPEPYIEPRKKLKQDEEEILRNLETRCFYEFAKTLEKEGQFKYAELFYQRCLEREPDHVSAHFDYGTLLMETQQDYENASRQFLACIHVEPTHVHAHCHLATIYTELTDNLDQARVHYETYFQHPTEELNEAYFTFTKCLHEYCRNKIRTTSIAWSILPPPQSPPSSKTNQRF